MQVCEEEKGHFSQIELKYLKPELGSVEWRQVGIKTVSIFHAMHWSLDFMLQMIDNCWVVLSRKWLDHILFLKHFYRGSKEKRLKEDQGSKRPDQIAVQNSFKNKS